MILTDDITQELLILWWGEFRYPMILASSGRRPKDGQNRMHAAARKGLHGSHLSQTRVGEPNAAEDRDIAPEQGPGAAVDGDEEDISVPHVSHSRS